jgi:hypothetical protein
MNQATKNCSNESTQLDVFQIMMHEGYYEPRSDLQSN